MNKKFGVIGLGRFGRSIARKLAAKGAEVMGMDVRQEKVDSVHKDITLAVRLDSTDKRALESQNVNDLDVVVIAIGASFDAMLLTVFLLQELGVKRIIARAQDETQKVILEKMGVTEILNPEEEVGNNMAELLLNPGALMCMQLPDDFEIMEVTAPRKVLGRSLSDIGLREKYNLNLVTLLRKTDDAHHIMGIPDARTLVEKDDLIVLFGKNSDIDRFIDINQ
jgi:trk system potassium uptake protein TrkA